MYIWEMSKTFSVCHWDWGQ